MPRRDFQAKSESKSRRRKGFALAGDDTTARPTGEGIRACGRAQTHAHTRAYLGARVARERAYLSNTTSGSTAYLSGRTSGFPPAPVGDRQAIQDKKIPAAEAAGISVFTEEDNEA